jgi:serine/threonine-protein kinase HipA
VQRSSEVQSCFENLLPEGQLRSYLAQLKKASTLFALLREVAGDNAGAFVIVPQGSRPEPPQYQLTTWEQIRDLLQRSEAAALGVKAEGARISLAGAQDKASLAIFADGLPRLPKGTSPSTHILKPDIRRLAQVWESAVNETLVMRLSAKCGLPTAEVSYQPIVSACLVTRFDRQLRADGTIGRLVQYDFCQLRGIASEKKYEKEGGPSLTDCADMIRSYSSQAALDLKHLVAWVFFNLYTGNNDSHAKNLSLQRLPDGTVMLTPFYDLLCTRAYRSLSREFAFSIGGEVRPGAIGSQHLADLAQQLKMRGPFLRSLADEVAGSVLESLDTALDSIRADLSPSGERLAVRVCHFIRSTTRRARARLLG